MEPIKFYKVSKGTVENIKWLAVIWRLAMIWGCAWIACYVVFKQSKYQGGFYYEPNKIY
jgi:hypothetical protein